MLACPITKAWLPLLPYCILSRACYPIPWSYLLLSFLEGSPELATSVWLKQFVGPPNWKELCLCLIPGCHMHLSQSLKDKSKEWSIFYVWDNISKGVNVSSSSQISQNVKIAQQKQYSCNKHFENTEVSMREVGLHKWDSPLFRQNSRSSGCWYSGCISTYKILQCDQIYIRVPFRWTSRDARCLKQEWRPGHQRQGRKILTWLTAGKIVATFNSDLRCSTLKLLTPIALTLQGHQLNRKCCIWKRFVQSDVQEVSTYPPWCLHQVTDLPAL